VITSPGLCGCLIAAAVLGCGGSDPPAPSTDEPSTASVAGTWLLTLSNFRGGGFTCNALESIELSQSGNSFSGTFSLRDAECRGPGSSGGLIEGASIEDGVVTGSRISFIFDGSPGSHFSGTVAADGRSMSGNGAMAADFDDRQVSVSGTWVAEKQ
jgi:hypothetical protein